MKKNTNAIINNDISVILAIINNASNTRDFIYIISNGDSKSIISNGSIVTAL